MSTKRPRLFPLLLAALIISGAFRMLFDLRGREFKPENCECNSRQDCAEHSTVLDSKKISSGFSFDYSKNHENKIRNDLSNFKSHLKSLEDADSWELPADIAPAFQKRVLDPSNFRLTIKVLTYNRPDSLERCFVSLENAIYDATDTVDVEVYVDHPFDDQKSKWSDDYTKKVELSHEVLQKIEGLSWTHGQKRIVFRTRNGGIQSQWLESWWPSTLNEFAFVVEDDMELSPIFYQYFKHIVAEYYYNQLNHNPHIYGVSFQRQSFVPGIGGRSMGSRDAPFLYELVGTWGQFLFPNPWKQFRMWYDLRRYNESREPVLQNLKTTQWWFNKRNKLWTPWIIKWAHANHLYNIYPSLPGNFSLSISHREIGANFRKNRKADAQLLTESDFHGLNEKWMTLPPMESLERFDLCFRKVKNFGVSRSIEELQTLVESVQAENNIALILVPLGDTELLRNWLCHVEGLNFKNYVLVVLEKRVSEDVARRGHPVHFLRLKNDVRRRPTKSLRVKDEIDEISLSGSVEEWGSEELEVILSVLTMGYNVLTCSPNSVFHSNPFHSLGSTDFDMQGYMDPKFLSHSFLFIQSSPRTILAWDNMIHEKSNFLHSKFSNNPLSSRLLSGPISFQELRTLPFDSSGNTSSSKNSNESSISVHKNSIKEPMDGGDIVPVPVVLGLPTVSKEEKITKFKSDGLWVIDDYDFSCKSVTCKKKHL